MQTEDFADAHELFQEDYAYFSGFSKSWLAHCEQFVSDMVTRFNLSESSRVVEVAANDGCLLQYVAQRGIPCLGVEPTASTARAARGRGLSVIEDFFGTELAAELAARDEQVDLAVANNVLAHVPDINDFILGFRTLLKPDGVASFEFPHLLNLVAENQFDTIYHEHFSYLSLSTVKRMFAANGLAVFDVKRLSTHGGSLRVLAQRNDTGTHPVTAEVDNVLATEADAGMATAPYYASFQASAERVKNEFLAFLLDAKRQGKKVAAYGAAAKGNTLLNYAGVGPDLVHFVVDQNPAKQLKFMPGSRIPIVEEARISEFEPDYVIVLPWNLRVEIAKHLAYISHWGGRLVTAIPQLVVMSGTLNQGPQG